MTNQAVSVPRVRTEYECSRPWRRRASSPPFGSATPPAPWQRCRARYRDPFRRRGGRGLRYNSHLHFNPNRDIVGKSATASRHLCVQQFFSTNNLLHNRPTLRKAVGATFGTDREVPTALEIDLRLRSRESVPRGSAQGWSGAFLPRLYHAVESRWQASVETLSGL